MGERSGRIRWTLPMLRRLHARRLKGERTAVLAEEVGCSANALRRAWKRQGWDTPHPAAAISEERLREAWAWHEAGMRTTEAAKRLGTSRDYLLQRWRAIGIDPSVYQGATPDPQRRALYRYALARRRQGAPWEQIATERDYPHGGKALSRVVRHWRDRQRQLSER